MNMGTSSEINASSEDKRREFVLDFIRQKDVIRTESNLIIVEKAFKINAVLRWCYERAKEKKLTPQLWGKYRNILAQYIAGVVEIKWTENNFIKELKEASPNYIVYSSRVNWFKSRNNAPKADKFILDNYFLYKDLSPWIIYKKR